MIQKVALFLFVGLFVGLSSCKVNKTKNGLKTGKWELGDENFSSKGRFRKGNERGKWKFYSAKSLYKTEKFRKKFSQVKMYHPNNKLMARGKTELEIEDKHLHWYYSGPWKYYDAKGKLIKITEYEKGTPLTN